MKVILIILALVFVISSIFFTYVRLPWADVFVEPNWR
jgi:hypothetical protein